MRFLLQICHVFSLDDDVKPDVEIMKRGLLKLLHVREFSQEAQFKNPSRSLVMPSPALGMHQDELTICKQVLPDVFCSSMFCSASRDVDLCRLGSPYMGKLQFNCSASASLFDPLFVEN